VGNSLAHSLDDPGRLVTEEEREVVVDRSLAVVQIGMADAARLGPDERLTRPRIGHHDRLHAHRGTLAASDDSADLVRHGCPLSGYSTVTDFARFLGWSMSSPRA